MEKRSSMMSDKETSLLQCCFVYLQQLCISLCFQIVMRRREKENQTEDGKFRLTICESFVRDKTSNTYTRQEKIETQQKDFMCFSIKGKNKQNKEHQQENKKENLFECDS